jgi:hypothetical protein
MLGIMWVGGRKLPKVLRYPMQHRRVASVTLIVWAIYRLECRSSPGGVLS